ncbi:MAG: hypothetical protein WCA35_26440 [Kovacikia sp.]
MEGQTMMDRIGLIVGTIENTVDRNGQVGIMTDVKHVIKISDISDEGLLELCRAAEVIACECPGYLARIVRQVRTFKKYTTNCIEQFPEDTETHIWLAERASQVEELLFQTMIELMRKEALIDEFDQILLDKLSERARETALKQVGLASQHKVSGLH